MANKEQKIRNKECPGACLHEPENEIMVREDTNHGAVNAEKKTGSAKLGEIFIFVPGRVL